MTAVDHQAERFGFQWLEIEDLAVTLFGEAPDHQVQFVLFKHVQQMVAGLLHHFDRQQRTARLDRGDGLGQHHRGRRKNPAHLEKAMPALAQPIDLIDELV
ncbi:hypothetical protein D3C85_1335440 [compost metagenome]